MHRHFSPGDLLFRQGDPSDYALRVDRGSVEILREVGDVTIVLGSVFAGQFVGEMGVIEKRPRSATARATTEVEAEQFNVPEFFQRVSADPAMAQELMLRLSVRLREIEDKIADDLPLAHAMAKDDQALARPALTEFQIAADTNALRGRMGAQPIKVDQFPFVVGRKSQSGERVPKHSPGSSARRPTTIPDVSPAFHDLPNPQRVRRPRSEQRSGDAVNGQPIGSQFRTDVAELRPGQNEIMAGGFNSDFAFKLLFDSFALAFYR